jgi:hypothetical protein
MVMPDDAAHRAAEAAGWTRMPELELDPELVALFRSGATEQALLEMRRAGFHILDGIRALKKYAGYDLRESKEIAHASGAWADSRSAHDECHQELLAEIERLPMEG